MAARKIGGLELEIKPSDASVRDVPCSRDPKAAMAPAVAQSLWIKVHHLACWSGKLLPPFPLQKKVSFKPLKISARATIYPGHFPEPSPRPAPSPPCVSAFSSPAVSRGTQRAGCRRCLAAALPTPTVPLRFQPQLPQSARARVPISSLGVGGGSPVVASRLYTPDPSPPAPGECCVSLSWDLGSLPCSLPPSHPAGSGTGVTGTLRPGCFPINCFFLIPLAVRRAASWLRLLRPRAAAGCPPARS